MTLNWVCKPTGVYPQAYPAAYARRYPLLAGFFMPVGYLQGAGSVQYLYNNLKIKKIPPVCMYM